MEMVSKKQIGLSGDGLVGKMITITTDEILFFELYRDSKNGS
jgi:hypothetical protein